MSVLAYSFSAEEFGRLVQDSISIVNNQSEDSAVMDSPAEKVSELAPTQSDLDDLETLDELETLDDLEEDSSDYDYDTETQQKSAQNAVQDLPNYIKYTIIDEASNSKIPDLKYDLQLEKGAEEQQVSESMFQLVVERMKNAFLITVDCTTYMQLWNANFVAAQTNNNVFACMRLLAMFFHIDCNTSDVVAKLMNADRADVILSLEKLGRVVYMHDAEIALGEIEPDEVTEEEKLPSDIISVGEAKHEIENTEDTETVQAESGECSDEFIDGPANGEEESCDPDDNIFSERSPKKLTKRQRLTLYIEIFERCILTGAVQERFERVKSINQCYSNLKSLLLSSEITCEEFFKFGMFLAKTREIILDIAKVRKAKTFNKYFAMLLTESKQVDFKDGKYHDQVFIVNGTNGSVRSVSWMYVALNWRLFQIALTKNYSMVITNTENANLMIICMNASIGPKRMIFHGIKSQLTVFAEAFTTAATGYLEMFNNADGFNWKHTCDDLDFYLVTANGFPVVAAMKVLSRQQRESFTQLLSYTYAENKELFSVMCSFKLQHVWSIDVSALSKNRVLATYQIVSFCLSLCGTTEIHLSKPDVSEPSFLLCGDGIPAKGITLTLDKIIQYITEIDAHVMDSSKTEITVANGKLVINFNR